MPLLDLKLTNLEALSPLEIQDLVEIIDSFVISADFFHWLIEGTYTEKIIQEQTYSGQDSWIYQYYYQTSLLFTGRFNLLPDSPIEKYI